uniref:Uncharacterized protein n=1 Tax=Cacopsylla melanoneura TaxID=428564 RepID=A0A8D9FC71_9HEMI
MIMYICITYLCTLYLHIVHWFILIYIIIPTIHIGFTKWRERMIIFCQTRWLRGRALLPSNPEVTGIDSRPGRIFCWLLFCYWLSCFWFLLLLFLFVVNGFPKAGGFDDLQQA